MTDSFDLIVVGAGPGGETVASRLSTAGMRTALVERELIGGECAYWACIPSKTLLRPAEIGHEARRVAGTEAPPQSFGEIASYRDFMIRDRDDAGEAKSYEERGVRVIRGEASFEAPGRLIVAGEQFQASRIVIATGSETLVPDVPGLEDAGYWTNREATTIEDVPDSVCVLGGGPVGIELAQMLRRFGAAVHVVEQQPRLLAREDERVGELIMDALRADEIDVHLDAELQSVQADGDERVVDLGERTIRARELLVATSRKPRLDGLRLDRAGIDPGEKGIEVDHRCRAGDGVWAIGDVTGAMPFSHVAKYQGRIAVADILGQAANADYGAIPRAVFCDPEVAAVGLTASEARQQYSEVAIGHVQLREQIARPWTYETDPRGELALIVDRTSDLLVGAWAVAPHASEWIHYAALAIKAQVPVRTLVDTVAQFPTYCEAYLSALEQLS